MTFPPPPTLLTRTIHYFALLHCIHLAPTWSRLGSQLLLVCVRVGVRASGERAHFHHHYVNGTFGMEPGDMLNDDDCGPNLVRCSSVYKRKGAWAPLKSSTLIFRQLYGLMQCMIIENKNQMHLVSKDVRRCGISLFRLSDLLSIAEICLGQGQHTSNDAADKSQSNAGLVLTISYRYLFVPLGDELPLSLTLVRTVGQPEGVHSCKFQIGCD